MNDPEHLYRSEKEVNGEPRGGSVSQLSQHREAQPLQQRSSETRREWSIEQRIKIQNLSSKKHNQQYEICSLH